ncbi:MAG: BON domain-containing protein [Burkholderiales bacterium]|nr:BON domain-containing protein [Burkholderiales bacterium]
MRRFFNGLLLGIIVGAGALWSYIRAYPVSAPLEAERRARAQASKALESAQSVAEQAKQALPATLEALELRADDIKAELAATGKVVRQRARILGDAVADATADARITAAIKAKLTTDPELSVLVISVDTTAGRVTLAGTVAAPDLVGRAMALALATEGVREVISTLQVK